MAIYAQQKTKMDKNALFTFEAQNAHMQLFYKKVLCHGSRNHARQSERRKMFLLAVGRKLMKTQRNRRSPLFLQITFSLFLFISTPGRSSAQTLSLISSNSYQTAINLTNLNASVAGGRLVVNVQITNTSGTWVYLEEDLTSPPTGVNYTDYLLGPNGTLIFNNVSFGSGNFLQFNVTTPIGLNYTDLDPKCRALFGALTVDYMMRGFFTTPLPSDAFDNMTGAIDPVLDGVVSSLGSVGELAGGIKDRNYLEISSALASLVQNSDAAKATLTQIFQRYVAQGQIDSFFDATSDTLDTLTQILDVYGKYQQLSDLTTATFNAPLQTVNRLDFVATIQTPAITSLFPASLVASTSSQNIQTIGSGFTSSSTLFLNGSAPTSGMVTFVSANEIDYNNTFQTTGTWSVQVINGSQTSNSKTFTVNVQQASTGSLVVNLSPANIGGQWQVNGIYYNSGDLANPLSPGQYTVSFKSVSGYTTPASFPVNIVANAQTTTNATYSAVASPTYALTLNAVNGSISPSPTASGNVYNSSSAVQLTAYANTGYHFTGWSGAATGTANPTTITMSANETATANFAPGDPSLATVTVAIKPDVAANAGVTWSVTGDSQLRASGTSLSEDVGSGYTTYLPVTLNLVAGWLGTNGTTSFYIPITAGTVTNVTLTCVPNNTPGLLTVTLSPTDAVNGGAHWHVNGGTYGNGASVSLTPGDYSVTFDTVTGWTAPASQQVTMQPSQTIALSGNYTPAAGEPAIGSVSPPIGPMSGGTLMTIYGANFTAPATVLIGGQQASNVSVFSASQITCLTPAGLAYGSTNVVVQTFGGSATNLNGFAYGIARGSKLDLISAIGGSCFGVAIQGNYAFVGEGRNILALDISTPSNPSRIGKLTLPGIVRGIAILNQFAYVADYEGGVQVVDISTPASPRLAGYYATTNQMWSAAISIYAGRAYVADLTAGLQIFDLSQPTMPALLSSTNIGSCGALVVKASVNGVFAYVSTGGSLCIVDVSNPLLPALRGQTSINNGSVYSLAMNGNYVYAAALYGNLEIIDVSNTNAPVDVGHAPTIVEPSAVAYSGGYIYAANMLGVNTLYVFSPNGSSLTLLGQTSSSSPSYGYNLAVSGTKIYAAGGSAGFEVFDIPNPYSPSLLTAFTDSGVNHQYNSVAVTGNAMPACGYPEGTIVGFNTVFDVSNPSAPAFAANPNIAGSLVVARNGIAYVSTGNSNCVFNVTTPSSPQLLKLFNNGFASAIAMVISGNYLYLGGYGTGYQQYFAAVDISIPSSPVIRGSLTLSSFGSGAITSVAINGTKAFIGMNNASNSVALLDISNISSPTVTGSYSGLPYYPRAVQISPDGSCGYVLSGNPSVLYIFNLSQASNPTLITNIMLDPAGVTDLKLQGNELFASTFYGLYVFDISLPSTPILTRSFVTLSQVQSIAFGDTVSESGYVYLSSLDGGVVILRELDIQAPNVYITDPVFGTTWTTTTSTTELGGGSDDNVGVTAITWANNRGGTGQVSPPLDNWYIPSIALYPGTNILTVTAYDTAGNSGTDSLAVIYQTANQSQTIIFPAIANHTFGDASITLDAAASSGLPVTFSVVSGPATLISGNVLTLTGAGSVTVQANQPGNSSYNPAPPTNISFTVALANQAITFAPIPGKAATDAAFSLTATTSSGLPVYFSVLSGPAGINSSNYVSLLGAGKVSILAWQPGNSNFNAAASVQQSFTVSQVPQSISFGALSPQRAGDAPFPLNGTASSGLPIIFSILSGPASLSGNVLTLTGWGMVVVRASQPGNNIYAAAANVDQPLTVSPPNNTIGAAQFTNGGFQLSFYGAVGNNYTLQASADLKQWISLLNFTCTNAPTIVIDSTAENYSKRFYRIAQGALVIPITLGFDTLHPLVANGFSLTLQGPVGSNYVIQVSTNLVNWQQLTNFTSTNATMYILDSSATNYKKRFYRAVGQ
jgi:hypothetical protein